MQISIGNFHAWAMATLRGNPGKVGKINLKCLLNVRGWLLEKVR